MSKLPLISGEKAIKAFAKIGYKIVRQKGSHIRLHHQDRYKEPLTIPNHKVLDKGLLRRLLRDSQLTVSEFIELL